MSDPASMRALTIDLLEAFFTAPHPNLLCLYDPGASSASLLKANLPSSSLSKLPQSLDLELCLNDEEVLKYLPPTPRRFTHIIPSYRTFHGIEKWALQNSSDILGPSRALQRSLEDKIFFHKFLSRHCLPQPEGTIIQTKSDVAKWNLFPAILQIPRSDGGDGTFFCETPKELQTHLRKRPAKSSSLLRKYVPGLAVGITLLVGKHHSLISALRAQTTTPKSSSHLFQGIQWLPSKSLSPPLTKSLEVTLQKMTTALRKEGFLGLMNFDLILTRRNVFFIECNPRFSGATAQLSLHPRLLHQAQLMHEYLSLYTKEEVSKTRMKVPNTSFEGCTLEISDWIETQFPILRKKLLHTPELGVYRFTGKKIIYLGKEFSLIKRPQTFFLYSSAQQHQTITSESGLGTILTTFPLFSLPQGAYQGRPPTLSNGGKCFFQALSTLYQKEFTVHASISN